MPVGRLVCASSPNSISNTIKKAASMVLKLGRERNGDSNSDKKVLFYDDRG